MTRRPPDSSNCQKDHTIFSEWIEVRDRKEKKEPVSFERLKNKNEIKSKNFRHRMWDLQVRGAVSRLVEQDVAGFARLLDVGRQSEEILDGRWLDLVNYVVVEDQPEAARLDDGDVVTSVRAGAAVDDDGHEVIHAIWVDGIIRLKESVLLERENSEAEQQWLKGHQTPTMAIFQHTKFKYIPPMITVLKIFFN